MSKCELKCKKCRFTLCMDAPDFCQTRSGIQMASNMLCNCANDLLDLTTLYDRFEPNHCPDWLLAALNVGQWQHGKIYCSKCQVKIGGFNFIGQRKCACPSSILPHVYLTRSKVDIICEHAAGVKNIIQHNVPGSFAKPLSQLQALTVPQQRCTAMDDSMLEPLMSSCVKRAAVSSHKKSQSWAAKPLLNKPNNGALGRDCGFRKHREIFQITDVPDRYMCPVCLELYCKPRICLPCTHRFCEPCLRMCNAQSETMTCPLCRGVVQFTTFDFRLEQEIFGSNFLPAYSQRLVWLKREKRLQHLPLPGSLLLSNLHRSVHRLGRTSPWLGWLLGEFLRFVVSVKCLSWTTLATGTVVGLCAFFFFVLFLPGMELTIAVVSRFNELEYGRPYDIVFHGMTMWKRGFDFLVSQGTLGIALVAMFLCIMLYSAVA